MIIAGNDIETQKFAIYSLDPYGHLFRSNAVGLGDLKTTFSAISGEIDDEKIFSREEAIELLKRYKNIISKNYIVSDHNLKGFILNRDGRQEILE